METIYKVMNWLTSTVGRFLFAVPFGIFGVMHFTSGNDMAGMVPIPGGIIWVWITGVALILAAASIIIGKKDKLASFLLGLMMIATALTIHMPMVAEANAAGDAAGMAASMPHVLKDLMLAGAAWMYSGSVGAKDKS